MEVFSSLGIDWNSVLIYVVNFGLLVAVIAYFFTGPILKMLDERKNTIKKNLEEAERIKNEFVAEKKKADADQATLRSDMEHKMNLLKKELDEKRKAQEEEMDLKKTKMLEEVRSIVSEEKASILKKAEEQTLELIEKVVLHVVSNNVPRDIVSSSVEEAWKKFR